LQAIALGLQLAVTRLRGSADEVPTAWLLERLERTQKEVGRMRLLVEGLLDATALRAGQLELRVEPVDLSVTVDQAVERLKDQLDWSRSPCTVRKKGPTDGTWDKLRLEIVISNLLSNALKYGAARPIQVDVAGDDAGVRLAVRDEGRGIADADL